MDFNQHPMFQLLSDLRREFHSNPELSKQEHRTTSRIKEILTSLGIELQPLEIPTGAAGLVRGKAPGKTLGIRADIDALPMQELNDVPYRSQTDGVMHSCGHDAHNTVLLGVAHKLMKSGLSERINGQVKLVFQPSEEVVSGARDMIAAGVMKNPDIDWMLALHTLTYLEAGEIGLYRGVSHAAADMFELRILGKGAHGCAPQLSIDPIVAGAQFVSSLQTIVSRNVAPTETAVVSMGKFQAGGPPNVIPNEALLNGTVRTFTEETRDLIIKRMGELAQSLETAFGVETTFDFQPGVPACHNDPEVSELLYRAAVKVVGEKNVHWLEPQTGGEDFSLFSQLVPASLMRLGCANRAKGITAPGHSPYFDLDEAALPVGVDIFCAAIEEYLA